MQTLLVTLLSLVSALSFGREVLTQEIVFLEKGESVSYSEFVGGQFIAEGFYCIDMERDDEHNKKYNLLERVEVNK
ncbi:MAG: hypothetical protein HON90_08735, partial [Halobacteriovoraceae bacterium]|nr:hypothetical protein [Halobacteriovoraceae bacterium]